MDQGRTHEVERRRLFKELQLSHLDMLSHAT